MATNGRNDKPSARGSSSPRCPTGSPPPDDPAGLQALRDRRGPATIDAFVERWLAILPLPLTEHDRAGEYWWELSIRQVDVSRTIVFTQPRHARGFFQALVANKSTSAAPNRSS
jgi:hypothetical protein